MKLLWAINELLKVKYSNIYCSVSHTLAVSLKCRRVDPYETAAIFLLWHDGFDQKYNLFGWFATNSKVSVFLYSKLRFMPNCVASLYKFYYLFRRYKKDVNQV